MVQLLKKRLREKAKSESDLLQELHSLNSQVGACRSQINSEKQGKETAQRDLMEMETTLSNLRIRYEEKSKKEIQHLKDVNRLEIQVKESQSAIDDMEDSQSRMKVTIRDLKQKLRIVEQKLFDSSFDATSKSNQLEVEESMTRDLRDELKDNENKRIRESHSHKMLRIPSQAARRSFVRGRQLQ